jgi:hypothetical protein
MGSRLKIDPGESSRMSTCILCRWWAATLNIVLNDHFHHYKIAFPGRYSRAQERSLRGCPSWPDSACNSLKLEKRTGLVTSGPVAAATWVHSCGDDVIRSRHSLQRVLNHNILWMRLWITGKKKALGISGACQACLKLSPAGRVFDCGINAAERPETRPDFQAFAMPHRDIAAAGVARCGKARHRKWAGRVLTRPAVIRRPPQDMGRVGVLSPDAPWRSAPGR